MVSKTVPFSARISVEDAEFISTLEYDGAHTPSDKLRALLAESRRRHSHQTDYGQNLAQMQEWTGSMKRLLLVRCNQLSLQAEPLLRIVDALPDLLATLQTVSARAAELNTRELQQAECSILQKVLRINELLLPLALSTQHQANAELTQSLVLLAKLVTEHQTAFLGERL